MNIKDAAIVAGVVAGIYFLSKIGNIGQTSIEALNDVGSAIGSGLFDLFHPDQVGEMLFHIVTFPNGARHSIPSRSVDKNGQFSYIQPPLAATRWQLLTGKDGKRYAAPL